MKKYTDVYTGEKITEYRCDDDGSFFDGTHAKTDRDFKTILNLQSDGEKLVRKIGVKPAEGWLASVNLFYPHCFRYTDDDGKRHEYVFGVNEQKRLAFYEFLENSTVIGTLPDKEFTQPPVYIDYNYEGRDYLLINGGDSGFFVFGKSFTEVSDNPHITGAVVFDGKLFACSTDNNPRVRYSSMINPTNWSGLQSSIYVYNDCGAVIGLALLGSSLYVFQERGMSRISKADSENYSVTKVFEWGERAYAGTAKVSGDCVWYFTSQGLYRFDGKNNKRMSDCFGDAFVGGEQSRIANYHGKTLIATRLNFPSDVYSESDADFSGNNALIVFDGDKPSVLGGVKVASFCRTYEKDVQGLAMYDGSIEFFCDDGGFDQTQFVGLAELNTTDFGTNSYKNVKAVEFSHEGAVVVELFADGKRTAYEFPEGKRFRRVDFRRSCRRFGLRILSFGGSISFPVIYYAEES